MSRRAQSPSGFTDHDERPEAANAALQEVLVCPECHGPLRWEAKRTVCAECVQEFPIQEGVPIFASVMQEESPDALYKRRQIEFFDAEAADFEATRPHRTPALYGWLMCEKYRRSLSELGSVSGRTVLTVCGGSGMDAEHLARAGARVIVSDISLGAALRAQRRAEAWGLAILPVVADAERLPVAERGVDLCYVHDGLHHLSEPLVGVREMARVASWAVSITEPARAGLTGLAVRAGIALAEEEAGNRVERLDGRCVASALEDHGFEILSVARYTMYYQHHPGKAVRFFSRPRLFGLVTSALLRAQALIGRIGNKLAVQAVRRAAR